MFLVPMYLQHKGDNQDIYLIIPQENRNIFV